MPGSLTAESVTTLFITMTVLALIPGASVLTVSARSVAHGLAHGLSATMGIVAGDVVFIMLAIFGLSVLFETLGAYFYLVKYIGGAYLLWLGITLWRLQPRLDAVQASSSSSLLSSFLAGLLVTLADQKAMLFYLGFIPAFLDLSAASVVDTVVIIVIAALAVTGAKLVYAVLASRARHLFVNTRVFHAIRIIAGSLMIGVGIYLVVGARAH